MKRASLLALPAPPAAASTKTLDDQSGRGSGCVRVRSLPLALVAALGLLVALACVGVAGCSSRGSNLSGGSGGSGTGPDTSAADAGDGGSDALTLPIEVLGDGSPATPTIAEVHLDLDAADLGRVTQMYVLCHRCGFYSAPEWEKTTAPPTKVKASVRILGGTADADESSVPWVDVTDSTFTLADDERIHGGVNGGFFTVRMALPLDASTLGRLVGLPGYNRVQFRFNGTDGDSNGFRVVDLQWQAADGTNLTKNNVVYTDPRVEKNAGTTMTPDVDAGKQLWYGRGILTKSSIVGRTIQASCSSCHAANGRDLQYFNYSNNAIVQRSRFHGLTAEQGQQIAAFLRYSLQNVPYVDQARPWNPPYQPGPGLDCPDAACSATVWAAGAGLDAVLHSPADAVKELFGKPLANPLSLSQSDIDGVMNANATMNAREMRVPLQFPDWNAWLPSIHPFDVWPQVENADTSGSFESGATFSGSGSQKIDPYGLYNALLTWLTAHQNPNGKYGDWTNLAPSDRNYIQGAFTNAGFTAYAFFGGGRGNHLAASGKYGAQVGAENLMQYIDAGTVASNPAAFTTNAFIERAVGSMLHWNAVKQWDMAQQYGLEGDQRSFIGAYDQATNTWTGRGEIHGWPFMAPSAFYLAPHMIYQQDVDSQGNITRQWITAWETNNVVASYYRTNQWYQMQMSINAGAQSDWVNFSMDWPYLTAFDNYLGMKVGSGDQVSQTYQATHYVRLVQARIKSAQYVNNSIVLYDSSNTGSLINNRGRYGRAQVLKDLTPTNYLDLVYDWGNQSSPYKFLDTLQPGLYLEIINGGINQFNQLYAQTAAAAWRRCDPNNMDLGQPEPIAGFRFCLDQQLTPLGQNAGGYFMHTQTDLVTTEQEEQYGLWKVAQLGAEPMRLATWTAWVKNMWP